jgi:hypothetical protein
MRMLRRGAAVLGALYAYDTVFCHERVNRNARALLAAGKTVYDYKVPRRRFAPSCPLCRRMCLVQGVMETRQH